MKKFLISTFILTGVFLSPVWAEEIVYDRYAPLWAEGPLKEKSSGEVWKSSTKHFPVYPFELVRWPVDKILVFVEKHHLYDKADWIYEQIKNRGVTPKIRSLTGGDSLGGGFEVDFIRLLGVRGRLSNTHLKGSSLWTLDHITDYQVEIEQEQVGGTGFFLGSKFQYENRGEEHFYGIGPDTSLGDGTSYRMERTTLALPIGYELSDTWNVAGKFAYQNVNITNGEDGGRGIIDEIFVATGRQRIPGLGGDELLSWAFEIEHDDRDDAGLPTEGGYERFHFSFNKGLESSSGFFKYRAEAARYLKVGSDRRVFVFRGVVEHNDEVGDRDVPFFGMSRLGGYGTYPRRGDVHRGFRRDRFYDESLILLNLEYRWAAWEYRQWRMDSVLFMDEGQVFGEWSDFQLKDFEISYGLGFRFSFEGEMLLSLEVARSHEGTQFYVKTRTPF